MERSDGMKATDGQKDETRRAPLPWRVGSFEEDWAILDANGRIVATVANRFFGPGGHALGVAEMICMGVNEGLGPRSIVFVRGGKGEP